MTLSTDLSERKSLENIINQPYLDNNTCNVQTNTINDGLCDDAANNKKCLYDGDDCCLEYKPKILCSDCQCKLGGRPKLALSSKNVKMLTLHIFPDQDATSLTLERDTKWARSLVDGKLLSPVKTIHNVENDLTCLFRCTNDDFNAWSVQRLETLNCLCFLFSPGFCPASYQNDSNGNMTEVYYDPEAVCQTLPSENDTTLTTTPPLGNHPEVSITKAHLPCFSALPGILHGNEKILVSTGAKAAYSQTEIVDFNRAQGPVCSTSWTLPDFVEAGSGGILYGADNVPVLLYCGGARIVPNDKSYPYDKCLDIQTGTVLRSFQYGELKNNAGHTVVNNMLWITGGRLHEQDDNWNYKESLLIGPDFSNKPGADLPAPNHGHCLVNLEQEERVYLLGGATSSISVWSISYSEVEIVDGHWRQEPFLSKGRFQSSCGVISDAIDSTITYVVIAGTGKSDYIAENHGTEFMTVGSGFFQTGPQLPLPVYNAASVTSNNSLVVLGGYKTVEEEEDLLGYVCYGNTILLFQCWSENCQWTLIEERLNSPRHGSVAMLIPQDLVSCS